jgi:hypothetical protein
VQFGTVATTLNVNPGAVFIGQIAANASANDRLGLMGTQAGGTPISLGTQFTGFSTLNFGSGAAWTVDASTGAASGSPGLAVKGFAASDKIDVTNLTPTQVAAEFNPTSYTLTTATDGTLKFAGTFSNEYFAFTGDGSTGTDITLATGSGISTTLTRGVVLGSVAHPSPLTITATGIIAPSAAGATGVLSDIAGNSLTNNGAINAGAGAIGSIGRGGGTGLYVKMAATLTNNGSIKGGTGGNGSAGAGGAGGVGAHLLAGTLTNTGSITGGVGGAGSTVGGQGGAGAILDGGTLITSGTLSGGAGGTGPTNGAAGHAVQFGTVASTLVVDPGAVFNGPVAANASVNDVLELSGAQQGGTAITLGTQFTNFSTLAFASGASGTVDATKAALIAHTLAIDGFGLGDTLDITNLAKSGTAQSFNSTTDVLTLTHGASVITLDFNSSVSGDKFVLTANGVGTDVTLVSGAAATATRATLASLAHDVRNFLGKDTASMGDRFLLGGHDASSSLTTAAAAHDVGGYGFASHASVDHGIAHAALVAFK